MQLRNPVECTLHMSINLKMKLLSILFAVGLVVQAVLGAPSRHGVPIVKTTSGILHGLEQNGLLLFKGIPYAQPPIGPLRWEPPHPFTSTVTRNTTAFGPSCIQQFPSVIQNITNIFNNPPPPENEDCLFLNIWAPASSHKKPVVFWIHGGFLAFGSASFPVYDGASLAFNQGIVVVTINYRTNAFGFPGAEELFPARENLGYMDQDLALQWVQQNIAEFGGDPDKVTIMGQSAGGESVGNLVQRHASNPPFRAAIMLSGIPGYTSPVPSFASFDALSKAVNCTQTPGAERLVCMRDVPADIVRTWVNGPSGSSLSFPLIVDNVTVFSDPMQRIKKKETARVPIMSGTTQDEGTMFTIGQTSLADYLNATFGASVTADEVRVLYPGLTDAQIIPAAFRDSVLLCPTAVMARSFVQSGMRKVFRYTYGAVFQDVQFLPGVGAWHASELPEIFGTFNKSTASPSEVTLSSTMQTVWANFVKNPLVSPAVNWSKYVPDNGTQTLAKLAYNNNVDLTNVVEAAPSTLNDVPCDKLWNRVANNV